MALFLIALLMLSSGPTHAESIAIGTVEDETIYIERDTNHREEYLKMSQFSLISGCETPQDGSRYRSTRLLHQYIASNSAFDCWRP